MTGLALPNGTSRRASGATNDSVWKSCTDLGHRRSAANQLPPSPGPQTNTQPSIRDVLWDVGHRRGGPALTSGRPAASSAPDWASCLVPTSCGQPAAFPTRSPSEASVCPKKRNVRFARSQLPQSTHSGHSLAGRPKVPAGHYKNQRSQNYRNRGSTRKPGPNSCLDFTCAPNTRMKEKQRDGQPQRYARKPATWQAVRPECEHAKGMHRTY